MIGVHPNTVRLYEKWELIPIAQRRANGYRVFTDFHIEQMKLARMAFQIEILQNGLRKKGIEIVKVSASRDFAQAIILTQEYLDLIHKEQRNAEKAIDIARQILAGEIVTDGYCLKRKEVSAYLEVSIDTLRNWELNGLLQVKRKQNGYRFYTGEDLKRLKVIRSLRCANYSLEAILRMLHALSGDPQANITQVLNTPREDTDTISACDRLLVSLQAAERNAEAMMEILLNMKRKFS